MTNAKKPHVHAEVIKAWADGAEIEWKGNCVTDKWRSLAGDCYPHWHSHINYRVKPEPVVKYHGIMQGVNGWEDMNHTTGYHSEPSHVRATDPNNWKLIAIVKTTFVDRVPVAMEIVK